MSIKKDRVMQELQRFGGAMYTPVILFAFFGLTVAISIVCKNTMLLGSIADKGTVWYDFWFVVEQGAWTVFAQMPILFAIAVPIGFAKKEPARCAMESFVIYMCFNYFISAFLTLHGSFFGVDYSQAAGAGTGLAMIANIKTLDMGMLGAIFIACCSSWIHNHFYDTEIPDWLGIFKGPAFVVAVGFAVMIPMALLFCFVWPAVQHAIEQFQFFLKTSGIIGVWCYTFSERILLPAGLHHFIYLPFIFGPAVCDGGIQAYWLQHLNDFATSAHSLKEMFPEGGFALHGMSKVFGLPGAALAMYFCAKPEKRKKVATLLIPATITAVLCGITEPLEFTFLFVAPVMYIVHCVFAGASYMIMHILNVGVGLTFSGGLIDLTLFGVMQGNAKTSWLWIPVIGVIYFIVYYLVFSFMIKKFDYKTPGRDDSSEAKLYTKADYQAKKGGANGAESASADDDALSRDIMMGLGGKANISDVDCCITRLRCTVHDPAKVDQQLLKQTGASGVICKGQGVQVVYGPRVSVIKSDLEAFLASPASDRAPEAPAAQPAAPAAAPAPAVEKKAEAAVLTAPIAGTVIPLSEVGDGVFSEGMVGEGFAIEPTGNKVYAPADCTVSMVFETKHAIGLVAGSMELIIHVGIDTVQLDGKPFTIQVKDGDVLKQGDLIGSFDAKMIQDAGYRLTTPVVVTNADAFSDLSIVKRGAVKPGEPVLRVQ